VKAVPARYTLPVAEELTKARVRAALAGDEVALRTLIDALMPVVQSRAARALGRYRPRARDTRQELADLVQEVFADLFDENGRVLRQWDPARGLSLRNFVGLVSQRTLGALLSSGRRTPWPDDPTDPGTLELLVGQTSDPAPRMESRDELERILDRMMQALSPRSLELFHRLCVLEEDVRVVANSTGMTEQAVYAARARFSRLAQKVAQEVALETPEHRGGV